MFPNVGIGEMIVIIIVALVVFGPKRLPEMMKSAGKALRMFQVESQKAMAELRAVVDPEDLKELKEGFGLNEGLGLKGGFGIKDGLKSSLGLGVVMDTPDAMAAKNEAANVEALRIADEQRAKLATTDDGATAKPHAPKPRTPSKTAVKKTSVKKTSVKKTSAKKTAAKKTAAKKTVAKKTATRKTAAKKTATKKTGAKRMVVSGTYPGTEDT